MKYLNNNRILLGVMLSCCMISGYFIYQIRQYNNYTPESIEPIVKEIIEMDKAVLFKRNGVGDVIFIKDKDGTIWQCLIWARATEDYKNYDKFEEFMSLSSSQSRDDN